MMTGMKNRGLKELYQAYGRVNRKRYMLLEAAVMTAVTVLFCVFSLTAGKLQADAEKYMRESGSAADAKLTKGTLEQYEQAKALSYVTDAGRQLFFAGCYESGVCRAKCAVLDGTAFETMKEPACRESAGSYPQGAEEVMAPLSWLEALGLTDPEPGMEISLSFSYVDWSVNGGHEENRSFRLSGYYEDQTQDLPILYFSEAFLKERGISFDGADILIKVKWDYFDRTKLEERLNRDLEAKKGQKIVARDSGLKQAVDSFAGSAGLAAAGAFVILLGIYMVIHNVLMTAIHQDIRQYGLLKVIGVTHREIQSLLFRQNLRIVFWGAGAGIVLCIAAGTMILPKLMERLYQAVSYGKQGFSGFSWKLLLFAVLFVAAATLLAGSSAGKAVKKLSAAEAYRYTGIGRAAITGQKRTYKYRGQGASLWELAVRYVAGDQKRFCLTVFSLFLGCQAALCSVYIGRGVDTTNRLLQNPDFIVGECREAVEHYFFTQMDYSAERMLLQPDFLQRLTELSGVAPGHVEYEYGGYGSVAYDFPDDSGGENTLNPKNEGESSHIFADTVAAVQVVDEAAMEELERYVKRYGVRADMESLRDGSGAFLLHNHELSQEQLKKAESLIGSNFHFLPIDSEYHSWKEEAVTIKNCGYLDITSKHFPDLHMNRAGEGGANYFIVSEKGLKRLGLTKQVFQIRFGAEPGQEPRIKAKLKQLIAQENKKQEVPVYELTCNSDLLEEAQSYIHASRQIMAAFSLMLLLLGLANYMNTVLGGLLSRKKEFEMLGRIGMTGKQLRRMLIYEGTVYAGSVLMLLITVGSLLLLGIERMMNYYMDYFTSVYPVKELLLTSVAMGLMCMGIPWLMYRRNGGKV